MTIHLGFTGTRYGMVPPQLRALAELLKQIKPVWLHHGLCQGADAEAHAMARQVLGNKNLKIHGHPTNLDDLQVAHLRDDCDVLSKSRPPLARNLDIVGASEIVIAAPQLADEQRRGGTWYTIRAARQRRRQLYVLLPNGHVLVENNG